MMSQELKDRLRTILGYISCPRLDNRHSNQRTEKEFQNYEVHTSDY